MLESPNPVLGLSEPVPVFRDGSPGNRSGVAPVPARRNSVIQFYRSPPLTADCPDAAEEIRKALDSKITIICAKGNGAEVPLHLRPLSLKATLSGEEVFSFGHQRVRLGEGKVLLTPANQEYSSSVPAPGTTSAISLYFPEHLTKSALLLYRGNHWQALMERGGEEVSLENFPAHSSPSATRAFPLLKRISEGLDETEMWDLSVQCLNLAVEAGLQARGEIKNIPAARPSVQQELFRRAGLAREALQDQPEKDWSLEELSKLACLSQFHLHRVFSAAFSQTPFQYLKRRRVSVAQDLLCSTREPIKAIAAKVGFESVSSFIRSFRVESGFSPTQYREAHA